MPVPTTIPAPATVDPERVPRAACRFVVGSRFQFADAVAGETTQFPFSMLARTPDAIEHWYWGNIIHDLSGMIVHKPVIAVDYMHDAEEILGFADNFAVSDKGLEISGTLLSTAPNDMGDEVYRKGKAGVPYEASIDWDGPETEIEFIGEGVTTDVNGLTFSGPGYVIRKWPLRAVAVCPYGADGNTYTQFNASDTVSVRLLSATSKDPTMPHATLPPAASSAGAAADADASAASGMISIQTLKQFSDEFGAKGTEFLSAGLSLDAARYQFALHERDTARAEITQFVATIAARDVTITELQTQLRQLGANLGQETPIETNGGGSDKASAPYDTKLAVNIGVAKAKFAKSMRLKGAAPAPAA